MRATQQHELAQMTRRHENKTAQLEALLLQEMDNTVRGIFKGPRYAEFERRLTREKESAERLLSALRKQHRTQLDRLDKQEAAALRAMQDKSAATLRKISEEEYTNYAPAQEQRIVSLLHVFRAVSGHTLQPLQFVFFFSILISILMETGIILAFATITVAIAPVLHACHVEELEKEACRVRTDSAASRDVIRHNAAMDRVRKAGKRMTGAAEALYSRTLS